MKKHPTAIICAALFLRLLSLEVQAGRVTQLLDGDWQIAEGSMTNKPAVFEHTVPVPGLATLATPPFHPPSGPKKAVHAKDPARDAFWYGKQTKTFAFNWPVQTGNCQIEAQLIGAEGEPVRSLRVVDLLAASVPRGEL